MSDTNFQEVFSTKVLENLFPKDRSNKFFDALYGDAAEGAYDIQLMFKDGENKGLLFEFQLNERPGKCLACNLTYGLPEVFGRHPIINVKGLVKEIEKLLDGKAMCKDWKLGTTREISRHLHVIPLEITL